MFLGKCKICNKDIFGKPYRQGRQKFCSSKCYGKSLEFKRIKTSCPQCGKEIEKKEHGRNTKFCSSKCFYTNRLGKKLSDQTKEKISKANKIAYQDEKLRVSISERQKGFNNSARNSMLGEKNPQWKGGVTPINAKIRNSLKMKIWRNKIFARDKYTCQICGKIGGELNADHIKQFAHYPKLRFKISNGRTLCKPCHLKVPKINKKYA